MRTYGMASINAGDPNEDMGSILPKGRVVYQAPKPKPEGLDWEKYRSSEAKAGDFQKALAERLEKEAYRRKREYKTGGGHRFVKTELDPETKREIADTYSNGEGIAVLAKKYQIGQRKVRAVIEEMGGSVRARGHVVKNPMPTVKTCNGCGNEFYRREDETACRWRSRMTCSWECRSAAIGKATKARKSMTNDT